MAEKTSGRPLDATGEAVRKNIRRIRDEKGISGPELSAKLDELHRPIPPLGIHRIESGQRRVDVDDLMAISRALGVWPISLLMPESESADDLVTSTAVSEAVTAERFWDWLTAAGGLSGEGDEWVETMHAGHPPWKVRQFYQAAYEQSLEDNRRKGIDLQKLAAELEGDERGDD